MENNMSNWIYVEKMDDNVKSYVQFADNSSLFKMTEYKKNYEINGKATIKICADTRYELYIDEKLVGKGPASPGGDFGMESGTKGLKYSYYDEYKINKKGLVEIRVVVTSIPTVLCQYTFNYPGLWLEIWQNKELIGQTDDTWQGRVLNERISELKSDYTRKQSQFKPVHIVKNVHNLKKSPLEHLAVTKIMPSNFEKITLGRGEIAKIKYDFLKIYSAYTSILVKCNGEVNIKISTEEIDGVSYITEEILTDKSIWHTSQRMFSIGQVTLEVENIASDICEIEDFAIKYTRYPVRNKAYFETSRSDLDKIYSVCMHTLEICRQDIHLDSPTHQEPLACSGDYYIQALMEYLNIYDPTLTAFDIERTAQRLKYSNGFMFHTTYSLMLPMWIWDYYTYTGDKKLINKTKKALECLFSRFEGYVSSENDLVEKAPNYMFVDWIVMKDAPDPYGDARDMMSHGKIDGFSLHHPPKSLGQSVLCMFYYEALINGAKIYRVINQEQKATELEQKAKTIKNAINTHLFDKEKGLYIGGLTTPNMIKENEWLPNNTSRTFYLKQANVLSVLFDIAPREHQVAILDYVAKDLRKEEMQPYFYHFLLEALYKKGLFEKYGFSLIERYNDLVSKTEKGLCEAWEYIKCDCSHAWGGTPAYILKKAISGFEIIEPGYKKIKLSPNLYNLDFAKFNISTPYGNIDIDLQKGKEPKIVAPSQIEIVLE